VLHHKYLHLGLGYKKVWSLSGVADFLPALLPARKAALIAAGGRKALQAGNRQPHGPERNL